MEQQVSLERAAQVKSQEEQRQLRQQEERMFAELWEADRRAKEEREAQRLQRQQERTMEQLTVIKSQMEAAEEQRQELKRLKEEEARLMVLHVAASTQMQMFEMVVRFLLPFGGPKTLSRLPASVGSDRVCAASPSASKGRWTVCRSGASSSRRSRNGRPGGDSWMRA